MTDADAKKVERQRDCLRPPGLNMSRYSQQSKVLHTLEHGSGEKQTKEEGWVA
jgi:hypothetical protein